ncbi:hypothetical protein VaNZ11_005541 [Volvox africanus]|uniref:TATA element modulatory factor 1 TATA binding domain-containing protein n=1 Tax=Volvox africanus TaxID=51714 RepID=A0ABQ5RYT6_9CHLO|nr:hypothetical protein VaNZ11_005541 [Volvox africanus]
MSRRDIEELIKQLQDASKDSPDRVNLDRSLFDEVVANLGRLEQALDNRPSLIKKLNEKIIKLEGELEILRNETRVNELEKKVQRLEGELQRSYATKNFTLKSGLLEIEKAYRDFISGSPAVQCLWDEVTLLLVEDKESMPQHILQRRNIPLRNPDADVPQPTESPSSLQPTPYDGAGPQTSLSYVHQQVDKFKDYTLTPGIHDLHDPNHPANLNSISSAHQSFPGAIPAASLGGAPDARAGEQPVDDRPTGLDDRLSRLREQYNDLTGGATAAPRMEPHWGSVVPAPSPLRPVSLFSTGGDGRVPDASALEACRDELSASLEQLKAMFAQYDWAPTPLPGATTTAVQGQQRPERGLPDASAFSTMADSLEVSVEKLRQYFAKMQWVPSGGLTGDSKTAAQAPGGPVVADASYFDSQAEVILDSVQHLRRQFQEAAAAAAAAAAMASGGGGGIAGFAGSTIAGSSSPGAGGSPAAVVIPDARYFDTQADAIAASVNELLRLYERSAVATVGLAGGAGSSKGPWGSAANEAATAIGGDGRSAVVPDVRAGEAMAEEYDASVQPLVDLFSSFMAHLEATRGSRGARGPWPLWWRGVDRDGAAATGVDGGDGGDIDGLPPQESTETGSPQPREAVDLVRMFAKYARAWPLAAATAATLRMQTKPPAVGGGGDGGLDQLPRVGSMTALPDAWPDEDGGAGGGPAAAQASPVPTVRFRISVNTTGVTGDAVTARLSTSPAPASLTDQPQRLQGQPGVENTERDGEAEGRVAMPAACVTAAAFGSRLPPPAAAPLEVLLASLESRHGRGLANSPEAVAVWRDLLSLLGVDPNSRPLPTQGSPAPTPSRRSGSGTAACTMPTRLQQPGASTDADVEDGTSGSPRWVAASASTVPAAAGEAGAKDAVGKASEAILQRSMSAVGGRVTADNSTAATGHWDTVDGSAAVAADSLQIYNREKQTVSVGLTWEGGAAWTGPAETATARLMAVTDDGGGSASARIAAVEAEARKEEASTAVADTVAAGTRIAEAGPSVGGPAGPEPGGEPVGSTTGDAATGGYDVYGGNRNGATPNTTSDGDGVHSSSGIDHRVDAAALVGVPAGGKCTDGDSDEDLAEAGAVHEAGYAVLDGGSFSDPVGAGATSSSGISAAGNEGKGLVAGGVRFQITLSEIAPDGDPQTSSTKPQLQPDAHPLVQFRTNINGVDPETAEATAAELAGLREVRDSLSEQLASTQELVRLLNRQLTMTLESRDDLAARAEVLAAELAVVRADVTEARHESDMFMRELVDAKVQLAEVQGEYMQVYLALKKALGNEKDMIAKIDELERILAVVGPGDVSVDEDYGSTVGQVSAMVTPREDYIGGGSTATGGASPPTGDGARWGPEYERSDDDSWKLEPHGNGKRSVGDGSGAPRGTSSGGRASSGGSLSARSG